MHFSVLFKCGFYLWHWTFSPPSGRQSFRGLKTALGFINSSLYFMCSVWNHSLNWEHSSDWNQWRMQFLLSLTVWQFWMDIHDHLFSISSSLFLSTLLLILRMRWWSHPRKTGISPGLGENGDMFHWPAHSPPHRVRLKEYGWRDTTGMKLGATRSHKILNICNRLLCFCDSYCAVLMTTRWWSCSFKCVANINLSTDETPFGALKEQRAQRWHLYIYSEEQNSAVKTVSQLSSDQRTGHSRPPPDRSGSTDIIHNISVLMHPNW